MKKSKYQLNLAARTAILVPVTFVITLMTIPKRWVLVNLMKLPNGDTNTPWYYTKLSCWNDPHWKEIWEGAPFCIGIDVRLLILLPFAIFCISMYVWHWIDGPQKKRKK